MYEIRCPHCQYGQATPFARIGAVAECPECGQCFRIDDRCIRRSVTPNAGDQSLQPVEELRARIGLSGLSEVMRQEGPPVEPVRAHAIPPAVDALSPHAPSDQRRGMNQTAKDRTANARPAFLYAFAGFGVAAFLAIVIFLLVLLVQEVTGSDPPTTPVEALPKPSETSINPGEG